MSGYPIQLPPGQYRARAAGPYPAAGRAWLAGPYPAAGRGWVGRRRWAARPWRSGGPTAVRHAAASCLVVAATAAVLAVLALPLLMEAR